MSDTNPIAGVKSMKDKKILGVPALYLLGGFVLILALYAWKSKKAVPATVPATAPVAGSPSAGVAVGVDANGNPVDAAGNVVGGSAYPVMPVGTVVVAPQTTAVPGTNSSILTNDDWLKAGVSYLGTKGVSPGTAQDALQAYLQGSQLSYAQGTLRDEVITEYGLPPTPMQSGGTAPQISTPANTPAVAPPNETAMQLNYNGAITDAYNTYLHRTPSATELTIWRNYIVQRGLPAAVSAISTSPEAKAKAGG